MPSAGFIFLVLTCNLLALARPPQDPEVAQTHADRGLRLLQEQNLPAAEAELRQAVTAAPQNASYLASLGIVLGMERKLSDSDIYFKKALRLNPADSATRRNLASNQFQLGHLQASQNNLLRVVKDDPSDQTAVLLLGMVDEGLKRYPAAVKLLSSVPEQVRQRPESIAALARAYYALGQKPEAQRTLNLLRRYPAGPAGIFLGGEIAAQAHDFVTAEGLFSSIWSSYPDPARLGYNLALAQYRDGATEKSRETLTRLIDAGYDTGETERLLARCYEKQKNFKLAVAALDKAIQKDPRQESNYLDAGRILLEAHHPEGALAASARALDVAPESAEAYCLQGLAETELARPIEARQSYARAVKLEPSNRQALLGLALAQEHDGNIEEAERTFELAIRKFPGDAVLYQEYGKMLLIFCRGRVKSSEARAVSLLVKALALNNQLPEAHYELGTLALEKGKPKPALRQLKTAVSLNPGDSRIHYALAQAYRRLGQPEDARRELRIFQTLKAKESGRTAQPPVSPGGKSTRS